jgi:hypothetical protein
MEAPHPGVVGPIPGLSDKTVSEVCDLLLTYSSLLSPRGPAIARAAKALFPDAPFVYPGAVMAWLWDGCWRVMDQIGLFILSTGVSDGRWALSDSDWQFYQSYPSAFHAAAMYLLYPSARRVLRFLEGPEPFRPSGRRLAGIYPYFLPSTKYARFVRDVTGKDLEPGLALAEKYISLMTEPAAERFPRIARFME